MSLLIHSMSELSCLILPLLEMAGCRRIVEVGAEFGGMTSLLADYVRRSAGSLISIDPAPRPELRELLQQDSSALLVERKSLEALPEVELADAYLLDGDHNYYTVLHELAITFGRHQKGGAHPLVFLHDVGWPCAWRDLYYDPDSIPSAWRHPYDWDRGVTLDNPELIEGGFRGCGFWAAALREGGPRNGVRKAVEDFLTVCGEPLSFRLIPAVFGLGVLYSPAASWSEKVSLSLAPYDRNPLLEKLERNRLENYLKVIEFQDREAERLVTVEQV